jgi:Domain of unknown function (DUF4260)
MKNILKLEELAMFVISAYALYLLKTDWWCYLLILFGPDISMFGYAVGNKVGAVTYNLFHHKGLAVALFAMGYVMPHEGSEIAGIILFGHASLDRLFGYGLKLNEGFKYTHLGMIGKKEL